MKYFIKIFAGCAICALGVMAGFQFAQGNIAVGVFEICLAAVNFPTLVTEFQD